MTTVDTFAADIKNWVAKVKVKSDRCLRDSSVELVSILKRRSPILTGAFRGNWKLGVNVPVIEYNLQETDKTAQGAVPQEAELARYRASVSKAKFGDSIYANESVPYAKKLEGGASLKAPKGVAKEGFAEFSAKIDAILQKSINRTD